MHTGLRIMRNGLWIAMIGALASGSVAAQQGEAGEAMGILSGQGGRNQPQWGQMAPGRGYLESHKGVEDPFEILGGPIRVKARQASGGVHVALPDNRELDERVFGTPERPKAYGGSPLVYGVPPAMRGQEDGQFTTVQKKSPFGDKHLVMSHGRFVLEAVDATATDAATTDDTVMFRGRWRDDQGNTYEVRCNEVVPHGVEYPVFGGVVTNHILHGFTRIGSPLMPTEFAYVAFWGTGEVRKNGTVTDKPVIVHGMLTELVRTEGYELATDDEVIPTQRHFHIFVPPFLPSDDGTSFVQHKVNTGFKLPNGQSLPFWHVMFSNLEMRANRLQANPPVQTAGSGGSVSRQGRPAQYRADRQSGRSAEAQWAAQGGQQSESRESEGQGRSPETEWRSQGGRSAERNRSERNNAERERQQAQDGDSGNNRTVVGMTNSLKYTPEQVTVQVSDTVLWRNNSDLAHTVTADPDLANNRSNVRLPEGAEPFDSGNMAPGDTYRHTFRVPGRYKYFCIPHEAAGMIGTVDVREGR